MLKSWHNVSYIMILVPETFVHKWFFYFIVLRTDIDNLSPFVLCCASCWSSNS